MEQSLVRVACFTGHRDIPAAEAVLLPALLGEEIKQLYAEGVREFRAGGAQGFDMLAALEVLSLKKQLPEITLSLILPFPLQASSWEQLSRRTYQYILEHADAVSYAQDSYVRGCYQQRNRMLVEGSDVCIAYCTQEGGGAAYTCHYAVECGVRLINLKEKIDGKLQTGQN